MEEIRNFIAGEYQAAAGGGTLDVYEPATGEVYARCPNSTDQDVEQAYAAARDAFGPWSSMAAEKRAKYIHAIADAIERRAEEFAEAESKDTGKPVSLARAIDIPRAAKNFRFFAEAVLHTSSDLHDTDGHALNYTLRRARGVAGLISPWNLPLYLLTWKIAPAIATGCTAVAKPSEVTPMTAYLLGEAIRDAGLPPGVINIVHGSGNSCGKAIVEHPDITTISFTGSTGVGQWIASEAGKRLKRVSLELGGKNPNIVFADADLDQAAETAARAAFTNQGQICLCGSRLLVERSIVDKFLERVLDHVKDIKRGDPSDPETQFGALVSEAHFQKVSEAVERAKALGATIHTGGQPFSPEGERCKGGYFYEPTVMSGLDPSCEVEQNEIFGPVVSVTPFDTEDEALAIANGTPYGLASMLWTNDLKRAHRVSAKIESGIVWINCWMVRDLRTPFGGWKSSGVGREGGSEAIRFFTEPKNVCIQL